MFIILFKCFVFINRLAIIIGVMWMENAKDLLKEAEESLRILHKEYPDEMGSFAKFLHEVEEKGALDTKTKELISIALSVVTQCKWCIAFHTRNAIKAGATKDEIMEACFVAALMGGGPALMYVQVVMEAVEEFKRQK